MQCSKSVINHLKIWLSTLKKDTWASINRWKDYIVFERKFGEKLALKLQFIFVLVSILQYKKTFISPTSFWDTVETSRSYRPWSKSVTSHKYFLASHEWPIGNKNGNPHTTVLSLQPGNTLYLKEKSVIMTRKPKQAEKFPLINPNVPLKSTSSHYGSLSLHKTYIICLCFSQGGPISGKPLRVFASSGFTDAIFFALLKRHELFVFIPTLAL